MSGFLSRALRPRLRTITTSSNGTVLANSVSEATELLRSQPNHYAVASFVGKRLLIAPRDLVTVPRLKDVGVGDVLQLDAIEEVGSREYTLRGSPYIPESIVSIMATVVEHTKGLMERIEKKKRRKGYHRTIKHKQPYTRIRINDISIAQP
jgi:large subunit ribosomal protein L21